MSISDHYTRALYRQSKDKKHKTHVLGLLLGRQSGLNIEVCNLIEVFDNNGVIDKEFCFERITKYKEMYKDLEVIGWYQSTKGAGDVPNKDDFKMATETLSTFCGQNHLVLQYNLTS